MTIKMNIMIILDCTDVADARISEVDGSMATIPPVTERAETFENNIQELVFA